MAELNIHSSISAPDSLVPFKFTSEQIRGLIVIKPTAPNLEKHADFALPDQPTANTGTADDETQLSASRKIARRELHDTNKLGDGIESKEDKDVINGQLASLISLRDVQEERKCRPIKKLKWEGREEGEELEEGGECACVTPTAREQRISQEILICPPPPCKKRRTNCKRKSDDMASPSSTPQNLHLLAAEQPHGAALQLVLNPPDLHTFPECIRSLFFHN